MRKKIWIMIVIITLIGILSRIPPSFFISDQILSMKVNAPLERVLKKYGLSVNIENIRWETWDKFIITEFQVMKDDEGITPLSLEKAELKINLWALLRHPGNPEAVLKEVTLIRPKLEIARDQNGVWDFQQYTSKSSGDRQLRLKTVIRVKNGRVQWKDAEYGIHLAHGVAGTVDLGRYPEIAWDIKGKMDDDSDLEWNSRGNTDIKQRVGLTKVDFRGLSLEQVTPFVPRTHTYQIRSGAAGGFLEVAWGQRKVWLRNGEVRLEDASLSLPEFSETFHVPRLVADFSPERIFIKESRILYRNALLTASGRIDAQNGDLEMRVAGEKFPLADVAFYYPEVKKYGLDGLLDFRLKLVGTVNQPSLDGEAVLRKGRFTIAQFPLGHIAGKFLIQDNDLRVTRLEGRYGEARLSVTGQIKDVFNPQYALKINGQKLDLAELYRLVPGDTLKTDSTADFKGELTGDWKSPVFSGRLLAKRLAYQEHPFENLDLQFSWELAKQKLQVTKLKADFHDGQATAAGTIFINAEEANWDLLGNLERVNLAKSSYGKHNDLGGLVWGEVILRGAWKKGEPFTIGPLFGTIRAEKLSYREFSADEAQAVYRLEKNQFYLESLQATVGEGNVFGNLAVQDRRLSMYLSLNDIQLETLLVGRPDLPGAGLFKGDILVEGALDELSGRMVGEVKKASWLSRQLGDIRGEAEYHQGTLNFTSLVLHTAGGDLSVTGKMAFGQEQSIQLAMKGEDIQIKKLAACFPETAELDVHGNGRLEMTVGGTVKAPRYRGLIELSQPGFKEFVMENGRLQFEGDLSEVQIRELQLGDGASGLTMAGRIDKTGLDLDYRGQFDDLKKLGFYYRGNVVAGLADFSGKLTGPLKAPVMTLSLRGSEISFGHFVNQGLEAQVVLKYPVLEIETFQLSGPGNSVDILGEVRFSLPMQLNLELNVVALQVKELLSTLNIQSFTTDGELTGIIKLGGTVADPTMTVDGSLANGLINNLQVAGELELYYSQHNMYIQKIELKHGSGTFFVNGIWEDEKALKLKALLLNFPLQAVNDVIASPIRLEGTTNADIRLEWSEMGIVGEYQSETQGLSMNGSHLGDVTLSGGYSEAGMSIVEGKIMAAGGQIQVDGYLPWSEQLVTELELPGDDRLRQELDLTMTVQGFPSEVANFMPATFSLANGRLDGQLKLRGTLRNPILSGKLDGNGIRLTLPAVPLEVNNVQSTLNITNNQVDIETFNGTIDKGGVSLSGSAELEKLKPSQYSLDIEGSKIYYKNNFLDGYGDVKVNISGDLKRTLFAGEIFAYETKISISPSAQSPAQSEWQPEFDLVVRTGKNVRYRQIGIADVTVQGELDIKGTMLRPELAGRIAAQKGVVTLYGQNFMIQQGTAVFKPDNEGLPYLDVVSSYMTNKAEILLSVKGQVGTDLAVSLDSQPHLSQSELYALLNWPDLNGDQQMTVDGVIGSNLSFLTDSLFGDFFYEVRNTLHIDYFYLETNYDENELRINMGDYVTDDLFVSFSRSFSSTNPEQTWGFDYHLNARLILGSRYSVEDGTNWRLTYGFRFNK